jgi:hypothetical protein
MAADVRGLFVAARGSEIGGESRACVARGVVSEGTTRGLFRGLREVAVPRHGWRRGCEIRGGGGDSQQNRDGRGDPRRLGARMRCAGGGFRSGCCGARICASQLREGDLAAAAAASGPAGVRRGMRERAAAGVRRGMRERAAAAGVRCGRWRGDLRRQLWPARVRERALPRAWGRQLRPACVRERALPRAWGANRARALRERGQSTLPP